MKFTMRSKGAIATSVAIVALALSGVAAYAYFTSVGTGSGSGTTASSSTLTLTGNAVTGLTPGGPAVALTGSVYNPGSGDEYLSTVTPSFGSSTCGLSAADFTFTASPVDGIDVAGGATTTGVNFGTVSMNNLPSAQAQGCAFTINYSSN